MAEVIKRIKAQWMSLMIAVLFVIAWLVPQVPAWIDTGGYAKIAAIALIFFMSGLSLKVEESKRGIAAWRAHLYIQSFSFLVVPLLCWLAIRAFGGGLPEALVVGFYLLSATPTTITSCAVFTQLANGNFAVALLNAIIGNVMGIVVSPALLVLLVGSSQADVPIDALAVFRKLALMVLLPLAAGQVVHFALPHHAARFKKTGSLINRWCVLAIIFFAFGNVFSPDAERGNVAGIVIPLAVMLLGHVLLLFLADLGAKAVRLDRPERIAAVFCAPQKTLALGLPLATAALSGRPDLIGVATLPLIAYHTWQLFIASFVEARFRATEQADDESAATPATP